MKGTSKTGLLSSPLKHIVKYKKQEPPQLKVIAKSAPYILKPFAGLYNPYPYGCSLLCNHPADTEVRDLVRRAKETWAAEGKNILLAEEVDAIRMSMRHLQVQASDYGETTKFSDSKGLCIGNVPEELFRRYTETDSRPLTPAPTSISAHTRASGSRRCVTPDPLPTSEIREKTLLILDLRRSHSQETLSWHGNSALQQELPSIKIDKAPTLGGKHSTTISCSSESNRRRSARSSKSPSPIKSGKIDQINQQHFDTTAVEEYIEENVDEEDEEEDIIKRRGRKRRKRGRNSSRDPPAFQPSIDPETQISNIGPESHNPSARPSLVISEQVFITQQEQPQQQNEIKELAKDSYIEIDSYLDKEMIKLLRRELNEEVIDMEFNFKRRKALEEAIKTVRHNHPICEELRKLQNELKLTPTNEELLVNVPRMFSRSSARFELPMDSRVFNTITPLEYLQEYVFISSSRKYLYNCIFNRHKDQNELENEHQRNLSGKNIVPALNEMMGKNMTDTQIEMFSGLIGWKDSDVLSFKTFCGVCALCERILAPEYITQMPTKKADPCDEIETVDFQSLTRRLSGQNTDHRLVQILHAIKNS